MLTTNKPVGRVLWSVGVLLVLLSGWAAERVATQQPVMGHKTNNNSAPGANNIGSLPCVATNAAPSYTEGNQVGCSTDLSGATRVSITNGGATATEAATYSTGGTGTAQVISFPQIYNAGGSGTWGRLAAGQAAMASSLPVAIASDQAMIPIGANAAATGAAVECAIVSAASTNSTNCKASAGNFYGVDLVNTTTTIYYLRLYNTASAPTCSSATGFIRSIPIPPASAAGGAGGIVRLLPIPINYGTGISYCLTGGSSSTDNTSAATGVFGTIIYK